MRPPTTREDTSVEGTTPEHTRTAAALVSVVIGMIVSLLMLTFVVQNSHRTTFELLWLDFTLSAGVALLVSAIAGGLIVAMLGLGRVLQLRLAARRHRQSVHETVAT